MKTLVLLSGSLLIAFVAGCKATEIDGPDPVPVLHELTPELLVAIQDMTADHQGFPRGGNASWDWIRHPRVGMGSTLPPGWNATVPWGQVYADTSGLASAETRFQIRNLRQYRLSARTDTWQLIVREDDQIAGANYAEDFQNDANVPADIASESARGGGISASIADGYNFHFFARKRATVNPADVAGMYTTFEARTLPGTPNGADAHLLASAGGDYWQAIDSQWDQWKTNGDWAIGRFKYVTPEWQTFSGSTLDSLAWRRVGLPEAP